MISRADISSHPRLLAESGLRSTPQREIIYRILLSQRDHPTAEEVFSRVKSELPGTSLATVYNGLEALVSCGLVKQVNLERGASRYCPNLKEHAHFHDLHNGRVFDIDLPPDLTARLRSLLPSGCQATAIEINFHGSAAAPAAADANTPSDTSTAPAAPAA